MYSYITMSIVMRDCDSIEDAQKKCQALMPQYPDENTVYMESWEILETVMCVENEERNDVNDL